MERTVHDTTVHGVGLDAATRCTHYDGPTDVIALRFGCCGEFFACAACHAAVADHDGEPWPRERFDEPAVLCGACGERLSVETYLAVDFACPACGAEFNPGCAAHYDRYFEGIESGRSGTSADKTADGTTAADANSDPDADRTAGDGEREPDHR